MLLLKASHASTTLFERSKPLCCLSGRNRCCAPHSQQRLTRSISSPTQTCCHTVLGKSRQQLQAALRSALGAKIARPRVDGRMVAMSTEALVKVLLRWLISTRCTLALIDGREKQYHMFSLLQKNSKFVRFQCYMISLSASYTVIQCYTDTVIQCSAQRSED